MAFLQVVGPFRGSSGYDRLTREFVREFVKQGIHIQLVNVPGWSGELPKEQRELWLDELDTAVPAEKALCFMVPVSNAIVPNKRKVNYTMFEADRVPASWVPQAHEYELTIVPTEACYEAWIASGVPEEKLSICPLGVNGSYFFPGIPSVTIWALPHRLLSSYHYRFLSVSALGPRKNQMALVRCWLRATNPNDNAILVLKTWVPNEDVFRADLADMLRDHKLRLEDAAPIVFVPEYMTDQALHALYLSCTHYISMSRGEGWDLAMMEAAACGLKLIAPCHTAYASYLREDEVYFIPAALGPARFEGYSDSATRELFEGLQWWEPKEDAAVEIIQGIVHDRIEIKRSPQARIANEYSWERAAAKLMQIIYPS